MTRRQLAAGAAIGILAAGSLWAQQTPAPPPAAAADAPAGEFEARVEAARRLTLLELLLKGGPLMYPLGLVSIVMVAFAIERGIGLRRSKILPPETLGRIRGALAVAPGQVDAQRLLRELETRLDPLGRVAAAGLRKANRPLPEIEKAIEDAGAREAAAMRRNCRVLSMVASIAPLLGLLGTVTGMIRAFMTVASRAEALGRTEMLAAGIYEALVTTAVGLSIAIPALVCYYVYVEKAESFVAEIDAIAEELVTRIPSQG